jgi:hypothetical protein
MEIEVSRQRIADLLCCGLEGGIGYWATIIEYVEPPKDANLFAGLEEAGVVSKEVFKHIHYPMCEAGGGIVLADAESPEDNDQADFKPVLLDWSKLVEGLKVMSEKEARHFADFLAENEDATTGDVFVQCAVLGKTVYG